MSDLPFPSDSLHNILLFLILPDCTSSNYSTKFQADLNHLLVGLTDGTVAYTTLQACMDECIAATTFVCRSIEIWKAGNTCYLSRDTAGTQPLAREANEGYDVYQRDCAP